MVLPQGRSEERLLESFQLTGLHAFRAARTGFCAISRTLPVHIIHQKVFRWESRSDLGENLHEVPKADELAVQISVQSRDYSGIWLCSCFHPFKALSSWVLLWHSNKILLTEILSMFISE